MLGLGLLVDWLTLAGFGDRTRGTWNTEHGRTHAETYVGRLSDACMCFNVHVLMYVYDVFNVPYYSP